MSGRYERQLVVALGSDDLDPRDRRVAMRAPSSGSATDRALPDVLAGHRIGVAGPAPEWVSEPWAIELKSTQSTTAYIDAAEVQALRGFCQLFGARPLVAGKFKRPGGGRSPYYLLTPDDCRITDGGNYGIPEDTAQDRAYATVYTATQARPTELHVHGESRADPLADPDGDAK